MAHVFRWEPKVQSYWFDTGAISGYIRPHRTSGGIQGIWGFKHAEEGRRVNRLMTLDPEVQWALWNLEYHLRQGKRDGAPRMKTNNRHETNGVEVRVHWEPVGE